MTVHARASANREVSPSSEGVARAEAAPHMNGHAIGLTGDMTIADWLQVIRAEYAEVPGLHLTTPEAQDLWALDPWVCDALLNALVDAGFLRRTSADTYVRDR